MSRTQRLLAVVVLAVLGSGLAGLVVTARPAAADDLPYTDESVDGVLGLCNKAGESIDHGRIDDVPFVWSATSSSAAPGTYATEGATATLFAFQPREGLQPGEWSGQLLTASSRYDNFDHPKAQATDGDDSLAVFIDSYPPSWDGLIQLRLYLGAPQQPPYTETYAATDIRVSGDTWSVVRGGDVPCDITTSISIEEIYLPPSTVAASPEAPGAEGPAVAPDPAAVAPTVAGDAAVAPNAAGAEVASAPTTVPGPVAPGAATLGTTPVASVGPSRTPWFLAATAILLVLIAAIAVWWNRRRPVAPSSSGARHEAGS